MAYQGFVPDGRSTRHDIRTGPVMWVQYCNPYASHEPYYYFHPIPPGQAMYPAPDPRASPNLLHPQTGYYQQPQGLYAVPPTTYQHHVGQGGMNAHGMPVLHPQGQK